MKKVWSTLVILAILVGMFVCMGTQAFAAVGGAEIFAVAGQQLSLDNVAELQASNPDGIVLGVEGLNEELGNADYTVVSYVQSDPMMTTGLTYVWPGHAVVYYYDYQTVAIVGVNSASTFEEIAAALNEQTAPEDCYVVAVGPKDAAAAVSACADIVDMFVTSGVDEELEGESFRQSVGSAYVVNVGAEEEMPLDMIEITNNNPTDLPMPLPGAVDASGIDGMLAPGLTLNGETEEGQEGDDAEEADGSDIADMLAPGLPIEDENNGGDEIADEPTTGETMTGPGIVQIPGVFTVNYEGNGADGGSMSSETVNEGGTYTFPDCGFTRTGYVFTNWTVDGVAYSAGQTLTVNGGITVTANWEQLFSLVYTCDEPHEGAVFEDRNDLRNGDTVVLAENGYTCAGYDFKCWSVNGVEMNPGDTVTINGENVVVKPLWTAQTSAPAEQAPQEPDNQEPEANESVVVKVTYDPNNGVDQPKTVDVTVTGDSVEYTPEANTFTVPEGKAFDGWLFGEKTYKPDGEEKPVLTKDVTEVTFTAQWVDAEPQTGTAPGPVEPEQPTEYAVTYQNGDVSFEGKAMPKDGQFNLLQPSECGFNPAEGKMFDCWTTADGATYPAGFLYTMGEGPVIFVAQWKDKPAETFVVHFDGNGAAGSMADVDVAANSEYTAAASTFTVPAGKYFAGWSVNGQIVLPGDKIPISAETTLVAQWQDLQDAGNVDTLMWTIGGTDTLTATFNGAVAKITVDGSVILTKDSHYQLSADGKTVTFLKNYLDTLTQGDHTVLFEFENVSQDGVAPAAPYAAKSVVLSVKPAPIATEQPNVTNPDTDPLHALTWSDRTAEFGFSDQRWTTAPVALAIDYGSSGMKFTENGKDFRVAQSNGINYIYLQPDMVNGRYGGAWPSARYGFVVYLSDNDNTNLNDNPKYTVKITLGAIPATVTATPANSGGNSPVTGDTNNVVLYVVLLAVLILALAVVIIIMVKRRNRGRR